MNKLLEKATHLNNEEVKNNEITPIEEDISKPSNSENPIDTISTPEKHNEHIVENDIEYMKIVSGVNNLESLSMIDSVNMIKKTLLHILTNIQYHEEKTNYKIEKLSNGMNIININIEKLNSRMNTIENTIKDTKIKNNNLNRNNTNRNNNNRYNTNRNNNNRYNTNRNNNNNRYNTNRNNNINQEVFYDMSAKPFKTR